MKATIFYFSGTGNSLYIAKQVVRYLGFGNVVNIAQCSVHPQIELDCELTGFVFPVYSQTIPEKLRQFIKSITFVRSSYVFSIATHNGEPGRAHFDVAKAVEKKNQKLSSCFSIRMPGNSIIVKDYTNPPSEQEFRLQESEGQIVQISKLISTMTDTPIEGDKSLGKYWKGLITRAARKIYNVPKRFTVDRNCTRCRSCIRLCPENNVSLSDSIVFGTRCSNCLACYHWCPQKAIHLGSKTNKRYHHPEVKMTELFLR